MFVQLHQLPDSLQSTQLPTPALQWPSVYWGLEMASDTSDTTTWKPMLSHWASVNWRRVFNDIINWSRWWLHHKNSWCRPAWLRNPYAMTAVLLARLPSQLQKHTVVENLVKFQVFTPHGQHDLSVNMKFGAMMWKAKFPHTLYRDVDMGVLIFRIMSGSANYF